MTASPATRKARAQLGATARWSPDADTTDLARTLAAEKIADYVRMVVESAPPLTDEQRERIAALLRSDR